ncbi:MAG: class I tRNA ligase family protein [Patescibacteria group bacterium]|nr:class I tRNA ligase family protein [Patescibacteria group bacterium]
MTKNKEKSSIPSAYNPQGVEDRIYATWEKSGYFAPDRLVSKGRPFTISMPPPNATGVLHAGHAVMLALQNIVARFQRMRGRKVLWLPGTDHAAIATQAVVEKLIAKEGQTKNQLGREAFLERVRKFVSDSQGTIRRQTRKMGSSCDWSRERYTLDAGLSAAVSEAFVRMHRDGLIYRGYRIVNWCPRCHSTLSDDEVEYKEQKTKFYYFKYGPVVIGTARPETKFQDKTIIVHPDDARYKHLHGKEMEIEWIEGKVKAHVIADKVADKDFGTGAMTITPAHSFEDFELAQKYKLPVVPIIDEDGKLTQAAGTFAGKDARGSREEIVAKLQAKGLVDRIDENYVHNLSVCYRCGTPVEPLPSKQWFVAVNKPSKVLKGKTLKQRAAEVVRAGDVEIIPDRFTKTYFHWMNHLRDWCISRQIWFGHRIPVWYARPAKAVDITYFVHGATVDNEAEKASGQADAKLSELGVRQVRELKDQVKGQTFDVVFCSDLSRAVATAETAFGDRYKIVQDKRLRECDYGTLTRANEKKVNAMQSDVIDTSYPKGESLTDVENRVRNFLQEIGAKYAGKRVAIVAHKTPQFALEVLLNGKTWQEAIASDWRKTKSWQPGWKYTLRELTYVGLQAPAGELSSAKASEDRWQQDPDTLDTWFSSGLWTFSTLGWPEKTKDLKSFHPTNLMETGYDLLFFWVARMILMSTYLVGEVPFRQVYFHGMVRDKLGRKMSKSRPETAIDPVDMIQKYGADAMRLSLVIGTTAGNDTQLWEEKISSYRNFVNKLWNIARFVSMTVGELKPVKAAPTPKTLADRWILAELDALIKRATTGLDHYEFSAVGEAVYEFTWSKFADWYLEIAKVEGGKEKILSYILQQVLKLWHPFTPFVTEHLWERFGTGKLLIIQSWPKAGRAKVVKDFALVQSVVTAIRNLRSEAKVEPAKRVPVQIAAGKHTRLLKSQVPVITALARCSELTVEAKLAKPSQAASAVVSGVTIHLPLAGLLDVSKERERITRELQEAKNYLKQLEAKLSNKNFVERAPEAVVSAEREKLTAQQHKVEKLKEQLLTLG